MALVIVALSLGAVFQNLSQSRHTAMRSEKVLKAVRLAHNLFRDEAAIAGVMRDELLEEEIEGESEWSFRLTAAPLVLKEFDPDGNDLEIDGIKELTLCILHGTDDRQQSFCFTRWQKQ